MDTGIEGDVAFGILASEDHEYASRFVVEDRIPLSLTLEETLQQGHLVSDRRHELEGGVEGYLKGTGDSLQQPGLGFPGRGYMPVRVWRVIPSSVQRVLTWFRACPWAPKRAGVSPRSFCRAFPIPATGAG